MRRIILLTILTLMGRCALAQTAGLYQNCQLTNQMGQAISGAQVYFLTQPANTSALTPLATVYTSSTESSTAKQPLQTNGFGQCSAYLAAGTYTVCYVSPTTGQICNADQTVYLPGLPLTGGTITGNLTVTGTTTSTNDNSTTVNTTTVNATGNVTAGTLFQTANPPGGSATALEVSTQNYTDTSQMINVTSLGCSPTATASTNNACFQTMANNLQGKTYFIPSGIYNINGCISIPLVGGWHIIGESEWGTIINSTTSGCIFQFTAEDVNNFSMEKIQFSYSTQQTAPVGGVVVDSVSPAILFNMSTHTGSGVFSGRFSDIIFLNASRGFDIQKKVAAVYVSNPVWAMTFERITGGNSLTGATVDLVQGVPVGMPRIYMRQIYSNQTVNEPVMAMYYGNTLDLEQIECNYCQNTAYDFSSNYGGSISGLHVESYTLASASGTPVVQLANSTLSVKDIEIAAHVCPVATACNSTSNPIIYGVENNSGGGTLIADQVIFSAYGDSKSGYVSNAVYFGGNTQAYCRVAGVSGFTSSFVASDTAAQQCQPIFPPTVSNADQSASFSYVLPVSNTVNAGVNFYDAPGTSAGIAAGSTSGTYWLYNYQPSNFNGWKFCDYPQGAPLSTLTQLTGCVTIPNPGSNSLTLGAVTNSAGVGYMIGAGLATYPYNSSAQAVATSNTVYACQFNAIESLTIGHASETVTTLSSGGYMNIGLYSSAGTKVLETGAMSEAAVANLTQTITQQTVTAGNTYWIAWAANNTTAQILGSTYMSSTSLAMMNTQSVKCGTAANSLVSPGSSQTLPSTLGTITAYSAAQLNIPYVFWEY